MILEQKKGPFSEGASFRVGAVDGRGYVHIGIQIPIPNYWAIDYRG